tara:strand:- start:9 stop:284 length:276 start_codon:yes stop_codon:yes gene_type:complete
MPRRKSSFKPMYGLNIAFSKDQKNLSEALSRLRDKVDRVTSVAVEADSEEGNAFNDFSSALGDTSLLPLEEAALQGDVFDQLADFEAGFNL